MKAKLGDPLDVAWLIADTRRLNMQVERVVTKMRDDARYLNMLLAWIAAKGLIPPPRPLSEDEREIVGERQGLLCLPLPLLLLSDLTTHGVVLLGFGLFFWWLADRKRRA